MDAWIPALIECLFQEATSTRLNPLSLYLRMQKIQERQEVLREIKKISEKQDEIWINKAKAGISHLVDGLNSDIESIKNSEFQMAREKFNSLIHLSELEENYGDLIVIGYWGNYNYFTLLGDYKNAALQVYQCTLKYPLSSLITFSIEFFDQFPTDLPQSLSECLLQYKSMDNSIKPIQNELSKIHEEANNLLIGAVVASVAVVGVGAIFLAPILLHGGLIALGAGGGGVVMKVLGKTVQNGTSFYDARGKEISDRRLPLINTLDQLMVEFKQTEKIIQSECERRIDILSKVKFTTAS